VRGGKGENPATPCTGLPRRPPPVLPLPPDGFTGLSLRPPVHEAQRTKPSLWHSSRVHFRRQCSVTNTKGAGRGSSARARILCAVTNLATRCARRIVTRRSRRFEAAALPAGDYRIRASKAGFTDAIRSGRISPLARRRESICRSNCPRRRQSSQAESSYQALQVELNLRFGHGGPLRAADTRSKPIDRVRSTRTLRAVAHARVESLRFAGQIADWQTSMCETSRQAGWSIRCLSREGVGDEGAGEVDGG